MNVLQSKNKNLKTISNNVASSPSLYISHTRLRAITAADFTELCAPRMCKLAGNQTNKTAVSSRSGPVLGSRAADRVRRCQVVLVHHRPLARNATQPSPFLGWLIRRMWNTHRKQQTTRGVAGLGPGGRKKPLLTSLASCWASRLHQRRKRPVPVPLMRSETLRKVLFFFSFASQTASNAETQSTTHPTNSSNIAARSNRMSSFQKKKPLRVRVESAENVVSQQRSPNRDGLKPRVFRVSPCAIYPHSTTSERARD